jgi:type II secretory pathway component PulF
MIRWTRNIFLAVVVAIIIMDVFYEVATGNDLLELPLVLFLVGLFVTILFWLLWALGLTRFSRTWVRQQSAVVLAYVEQAVRLNLPLPQLLRAAEASEPRWIAFRIARLRTQLDQGHSITDALRKAVPGTSRRTLALVGAAERVGRLGPELDRLVREQQNAPEWNIANRSFLRAYPAAMIVVIVFILFLITVFVMPKFVRIFHDFRVPLPPLTQMVIHQTSFPNAMAWVIIAIGGSLLTTIAQRLQKQIDWMSPVRWFASSRDLADICHVIAGNLGAGQPLNLALRDASGLAVGGRLRRKLQQWAGGIERGMPVKDAAINAGMPALIAGLTTTAEGFSFLSRYYSGKFSRLKIMLRAAAVPAMVFTFGIIVAIVALSLFLPLIALINSVSPGTGAYSSWL